MVELATGFATLSMFLGWQLLVTKRKAEVLDSMISSVLNGDLVIRRNEDGNIEVKINNGECDDE